jgi:hypothetical protein
MISVVVSTYRANYLRDLKDNISATIGTDFEIIAIENSAKKGVCEVYNRGTKHAKSPFVCYAHEDIEIKVINWGYKVNELFMPNKQLGLLGIAGSDNKTAIPSGWSFRLASHHSS